MDEGKILTSKQVQFITGVSRQRVHKRWGDGATAEDMRKHSSNLYNMGEELMLKSEDVEWRLALILSEVNES